MGEAKRRQKLDPNYGKIFDLSSAAAKERHSQLIVEQLFTDCRIESVTLISAKTFPDNYQSICDRLAFWFEQKLLQYRPQDRKYIAQYVLGIAATIGDEFVQERPFGQQDDISLAFFCCIFQAIRNHLEPSGLNKLQLNFQKKLEQLSPNNPVRPFLQSVLLQIPESEDSP